ncbi:hypothetical protein, partial [Delftia acidovorans]|uniref:hypothetical protein n=1 Tax=Delftia acidovorans TaxID=80866 RepID=UPI0035A0EEDE
MHGLAVWRLQLHLKQRPAIGGGAADAGGDLAVDAQLHGHGAPPVRLWISRAMQGLQISAAARMPRAS